MTTWNRKTYHLNGLEIMNGQLCLNDNPLKIGEWSIEPSSDGDLLIKNDKIVHAKISCNNTPPSGNTKDRFFITDAIDIDECIGLLVSNTNRFYNFDFTQSPTIQNTLPTIKLTTIEKDPTILGVISGCENFEREYDYGAFKTVSPQTDGINRVIVSTSGIGSMWVIDKNGTFKNGDFITSSGICGYGMKQTPFDVRYNYTWGKILMDCNFFPELKTLQQPIEFDRDGPIYKPLLNSEGNPIKDYEYRIKYIRNDGTECTLVEYEHEMCRILEKMYSEYETKLTDYTMDKIEKALHNNSRTIYRACLVGYTT